QIVDKFLYCANSSKQTGGSKKIKEANLPSHTHTGTTNTTGSHSHSITKRGYTNLAAGSDRQGMNRYDISSDPVDSSAGIFCGTTGNHSTHFHNKSNRLGCRLHATICDCICMVPRSM
ncbi:phage tail repeat-like family, partial [Trichomonas vaginalis G3]|uniref:phage tail repeat-like family n=1 Tax=Trichomonas vaginalis (strain ATCC PRA-98 / G3) TaxID=412133 RepID=UPI0021E56DFD